MPIFIKILSSQNIKSFDNPPELSGAHRKADVYSIHVFTLENIQNANRLFYLTVISPAEREAAYTIDGLLHNEVVQSDIHSTDTHGYNEIIFAVTHLLGISFAPRIADFKKTVSLQF
ncbi:MAG TPA: Tn3 family transposase [bacterium]|nr:Tn3 family transposase [bacterium]HQN74348.1 Tn3 family transposase [bacterium]HQO91186.1 Tn3 family transposase [bacterium]